MDGCPSGSVPGVRICGAPLKNYSCSSQAATSFDFVVAVAECDLTLKIFSEEKITTFGW